MDSVLIAHLVRKNNPNALLFKKEKDIREVEEYFKMYDRQRIDFSNEMEIGKNEYTAVKLSPNQWVDIEKKYILNTKSTASLAINNISREIDLVKTIYLIKGNKIFFKKITKSNFLKDKKIFGLGIGLSDGPEIIKNSNEMIAFGNTVDAILDLANQEVMFISYHNAVGLFPILSDFYKEATQSEVDEFLGNDIFKIHESFNTSTVGSTNRKKISFFQNEIRLNIKNPEVASKIERYSEKYLGKNLAINNHFEIKNNSDITDIMHIICGSYYENEITGEKMLACSSKKLNESI